MRFNQYQTDEFQLIAKAVWEMLLCDHSETSPPEDFGSLLKALAACCDENKQSRILLE